MAATAAEVSQLGCTVLNVQPAWARLRLLLSSGMGVAHITPLPG